MTVTTALTAAALVAALTSTTSFADTSGPRGDGVSVAAGKSGKGGTAAGTRWVTLITGDRVGVDAAGKPVAVDRAEGREKIPLRSFTEKGRTYVVPADAERLLAQGTLDRRLFDVSGLSSPESRRAYRKGLKVIVAYEGSSGPSARQGVRGSEDVAVRRSLPSLNADAVTVSERDATALWDQLTRAAGGKGARTVQAAPGVRRIWLDAVRTVHLDKGTAQIGAPKAWEAGYDGKGVTIAVLDTGVDATHPDLETQVIAAKNFTSSPDTKDRVGHGTHVASTAAGTGAKSGGAYKGVAPGARILNAKVLNDMGMSEDSGAIAGIDWAVAQGADVINMSFGTSDTPGLDPLEAHVNKVTKEKGVLFTVSAGNEGPGPGSVGSPGSAEAALTVGAVDEADKLARFSSIGPLADDGAIKPDVTAPGVGTTAASAPGSDIALAVGENPAGYVSISGTSMAAPHAAGAAALLKQQHPGWSGERLKAALTASAKDVGHTVFQQGTGRIAVDRAIGQTVVADATTVSFGRQQWPHTDDKPVTKEITYRNLGAQEVSLDLTVQGTDPQGKPAPAGFFTLGTDKVTVPAGGTATVPFTADTRIGDADNGAYTAAVIATGAGQTVRTTAAVDREVESYDLTLDYVGRDGKPNLAFFTHLAQISGAGNASETDPGGRSTTTFRLPAGDYAIHASLSHESGESDRLVHPRLALTKNTTVTVDARRTKPVTMSVPDPRARMTAAGAAFSVGIGERSIESTSYLSTLDGFRTAQLGPEQPAGVKLKDVLLAQWERDASTQYNLAAGGEVKRLFTGYSKKFEAGDFAKATATLGASVTGKTGRTTASSGLERLSFPSEYPFALPGSRTHYLATDGKANLWSLSGGQLDAQGWEETEYISPERDRRPGTSHRTTLGSAVHSPLTDGKTGVLRQENKLKVVVPLFSDGRGNAGRSAYLSAKTTLHQGATEVGEKEDPLAGWESFTVGADDAEYTLTTSVTRSPSVSAVGTRIDGSWTFRSAKPPTAAETRTALSTVRFGAQVDLDGTAPADRTVTFPVTVQGPAAGTGLKSLEVSVSYDGGATWQRTPVTNGEITIKNPAKGKSLALRGEVADTQGGKASVTVYDAYIGE
ncbi:S8 family peptidase [Streptomyces jumonjinensis]|uniref:S8 family peptidase n=1 Tax=Streptomyces jumonjinensis TaxID=1945 RepID=UPI0037ACBFDB